MNEEETLIEKQNFLLNVEHKIEKYPELAGDAVTFLASGLEKASKEITAKSNLIDLILSVMETGKSFSKVFDSLSDEAKERLKK